jgi:hypothetical protein
MGVLQDLSCCLCLKRLNERVGLFSTGALVEA